MRIFGKGRAVGLAVLNVAVVGLPVLGLGAIVAGDARADDAIWSAAPGSGDYNAGANWVGGTVPDGTATFGATSNNSLFVSQNTTTLGGWVFTPGAPAYGFNLGVANGVEFTGAGIVTNGAPVTVTVGSSSTLYFSHASGAGNATLVNATSQSSIVFSDDSTAANAHITNSGGVLHFVSSSTAGSATITTQARTIFDDDATGGNATIDNAGDLEFYYHSTAGNAAITNSSGGNVLFNRYSDSGSATITNSGKVQFSDNTKAGTATITNYNLLNFETAANADGATIDNHNLAYFKDDSSAGSAAIGNSGTVYFRDNSMAASATIANSDIGIVQFEGNSSAGEASIQNDGVLFLVDNTTAASSTINNTKLLGFQGMATAGDATIVNSETSQLIFFNEATGGNAQIVNDGYFDIANTTAGFANSVGSLAGSGEFHLGNHLLTVGSNGLSTEVSGVIDGVGGALTKTGSGKLTLSGANLYTGPTTVDGGKLVVNGSLLSAVTVNDGGALGGNGQVAGITATLGAVIAPGNSIGTLGVHGDVALAAGSSYEVEIDGVGGSDKIAATGMATLDGGTVAVQSSASGFALGTRYTILTADLGVTGTFATLQAPEMTPFLAFSLGYDPANVYLYVDRSNVTFASAGETPNETATGGGADSLALSSPVVGALAQLDMAGAALALDQMSGEAHASIKGVMIDDSRFVRGAALERLRSAFGDGMAPGQTVAAYEAMGAVKAPANTDRFALWGSGFGSWGSWDGDGNAASVDRDVGGVFVGADGLVGDAWRLGVIGGYSQSNFSFDRSNTSATSDNYDIGAYAGTEWGAVAFRSGLAYTWHDISTRRGVVFPGFAESLSADYSAGTAQAFGELAYQYKAGQTAFEPFANLAYVNLSTDGFTEQGGAAALTSESGDGGVTYTTLGLRASTVFAIGNGMTATARGTVGWVHAFGDTSPISTFAFSGGSAFDIAGVPIASDAALLDAGLDVNLTPTATIGVNYGGQLSSEASDQTLSGTFKVAF